MQELEELKKELDSLGASWNLFGKVDRMKLLVEQLKFKLNKKNE
jgi:hypothetical protein|tara:strand:+ start:1720 stop:1851 length:132 start_codon:yes stop_codon:yes gene_type:complete